MTRSIERAKVLLTVDCWLQEGVDLLVATPGRVSTLIEAEALSLEDCRAVVLDEVRIGEGKWLWRWGKNWGRINCLIADSEGPARINCLLVYYCAIDVNILHQVDVLFMDETFKLAPIGTSAPEDTQFIFVTATLPQVFMSFTASGIHVPCCRSEEVLPHVALLNELWQF